MKNFIIKDTSNWPTPMGELRIQWNDPDKMILVVKHQQLTPFKEPNVYRWPKAIEEFFSERFDLLVNTWNLYNTLPPNPKILDIGAGNSIIDLFAAQYITDSTFYLVDRNEFNISNFQWFSENSQFYNDWSIVNDAIETSGLDKDRFNMLDPVDSWPAELDLITSFASWCNQYPFIEQYGYWEKVKQSLKVGGILCLDISNHALVNDPNMINTINEVLGTPVQVVEYFPPTDVSDSYWRRDKNDTFLPGPNGSAGRYVKWIRRS
jgi:hypothetical protein